MQALFIKPGETKNFCIVDAGMNDQMRPALYEAYMGLVPLTRKDGEMLTYDVVGPVCESGDWLGRDRQLTVEAGNRLALLSAGAYGMSMASNYNTRGRPAEIMVSGSSWQVIRRRETPEELFASETVWSF